ncbi:MAG TPA: M14 metallopeptidase family protein, partial [Chryseosolibacter sp.]|nr:M14 metallopeptidase family protein [Chryseosolibacter sp.]
MKFLTAALLFFSPLLTAYAQEKLLSPSEFLGYELGDRFTLHSRAVDYFRHVASVMPNAELFSYGETYEKRPLHYLVITSPENFAGLERIRLNNLKRAGVLKESPSGEEIAIVWLSYNVHGNEASSMEASMRTLYELANPENARSREWLKNTVVIMDPCVNPDGRDRYANFYNQFGNRPPNPAADAAEHHEPWPGGRTNHYFFDLNRDWAWCTQQESQQRIKVYNQWLPHVHVDFHEQGYNSPYFFAPAAEPLHEVISDWQRDFQLIIGKNNAKYFDEKGWLYFTKEVFDLYYPSYGDTYPTYSGAIGMTYEQAGGGAGGLTIKTETGHELTLRDRIEHHHTTGLATVEITSANATRVTREFAKYFRENNNNPASPYKTYLIKGSDNPDKLARITQWLDAHAIRYGHPASGKTTRAFSYTRQTTTQLEVSSGDIIIPVHQPKARFITTVFEPSSTLSDSLTYDITAWNVMYANNLDA